MSQLLKNVSLKSMNTFGVDVSAREVLLLDNVDDLAACSGAIKNASERLVIGGGSNLLFTEDYQGLIIQPAFKGTAILEESAEQILIRAGAGENWHQFVDSCIERGWYGLENLSLIPGLVGAAPIQNIGAYGVEIKDRIQSIELVDLVSLQKQIWSNSECEFGYRDSRLKRAGQGRYLVTAVVFRLDKRFSPVLSYRPLKEAFANTRMSQVGAREVADTVCAIRRSKLPDPNGLPNAGSFFKNPVVSVDQYQSLKAKFADLVAYPAGDNYKLAAGWLIEKAGFKGWRDEQVGVHDKQALVLINHNAGNGLQILALAKKIMAGVDSKFGVMLEPEVRIIGRRPLEG